MPSIYPQVSIFTCPINCRYLITNPDMVDPQTNQIDCTLQLRRVSDAEVTRLAFPLAAGQTRNRKLSGGRTVEVLDCKAISLRVILDLPNIFYRRQLLVV